MSAPSQVVEELEKLKATEETLTRVKGERYATCVSRTLRILMLQECLLKDNDDKLLKIIAEETANDTLIMGLLASGVTDSQAAREEFTTNLTMMTNSMRQVFRSISQ